MRLEALGMHSLGVSSLEASSVSQVFNQTRTGTSHISSGGASTNCIFSDVFFANHLAKNSLKHPEFLHILAYLYASVHHFDIWGFVSMGGTPDGWLISWKMPLKLG